MLFIHRHEPFYECDYSHNQVFHLYDIAVQIKFWQNPGDRCYFDVQFKVNGLNTGE